MEAGLAKCDICSVLLSVLFSDADQQSWTDCKHTHTHADEKHNQEEIYDAKTMCLTLRIFTHTQAQTQLKQYWQTHHCRLNVTIPNQFPSDMQTHTFRHTARWTGCSRPNNCSDSSDDRCERLNGRVDKDGLIHSFITSAFQCVFTCCVCLCCLQESYFVFLSFLTCKCWTMSDTHVKRCQSIT